MSKTKFYQTSNNVLINVKNIAVVEPAGNFTKIRLNITDENSKYITVEVHRSWSTVASDIEALSKS